uniref:Uncharacterized protein n=1 Tax=Caenorhabditis japonica TaxID=281687 RepID=A0A8R1IR42_CAEJA
MRSTENACDALVAKYWKNGADKWPVPAPFLTSLCRQFAVVHYPLLKGLPVNHGNLLIRVSPLEVNCGGQSQCQQGYGCGQYGCAKRKAFGGLT